MDTKFKYNKCKRFTTMSGSTYYRIPICCVDEFEIPCERLTNGVVDDWTGRRFLWCTIIRTAWCWTIMVGKQCLAGKRIGWLCWWAISVVWSPSATRGVLVPSGKDLNDESERLTVSGLFSNNDMVHDRCSNWWTNEHSYYSKRKNYDIYFTMYTTKFHLGAGLLPAFTLFCDWSTLTCTTLGSTGNDIPRRWLCTSATLDTIFGESSNDLNEHSGFELLSNLSTHFTNITSKRYITMWTKNNDTWKIVPLFWFINFPKLEIHSSSARLATGDTSLRCAGTGIPTDQFNVVLNDVGQPRGSRLKPCSDNLDILCLTNENIDLVWLVKILEILIGVFLNHYITPFWIVYVDTHAVNELDAILSIALTANL